MSLLLLGSACLLSYLVMHALVDQHRLQLLQSAATRSRSKHRVRLGRRRANSKGDQATGQEVLLAILAGVSARLSAGAPPEQAWAELPSPSQREGLAAALWQALPPATGWHATATQQVLERAIGQVVAADDLARTRGMSLARLLARVQAGLETELELHTAQVSALTPARTSARLLRWLPILGLGLGVLLGFNPAAVLLGSVVGRACLLGAIGCVMAGHFWSRALLHRALLPPSA